MAEGGPVDGGHDLPPGRLHILLIPAWYPTAAAPGNGVFVRDQARAAALHHDVSVMTDEGPLGDRRLGNRIDEADEDGLRVLRVTRGRSTLGPVPAVAYVAAVLASIRRLERGGRRPDVLHAHVYHAGVAALVAGRRYGIPVVVSEHSSHFLEGTLGRAARLRARAVFRSAALVCPVSEHLRRGLEAVAPQARYRVVPNAVDTDLFAGAPPPRRDDAGRARALVVSGLQDVKGVATLLRAVAIVAPRRDDFHLDVVGDGPERGACERLVAEHGLAGRVTFHGRLAKPEVAAHVGRSSFLVVPSRTESFGVAAVEALAAGRGVLAARVGALPEFLDADTGVLVGAPGERELAAGLEQMLDRFERLDAARLSARAVERFGFPAVGARWDEIYRGLAGGRPS